MGYARETLGNILSLWMRRYLFWEVKIGMYDVIMALTLLYIFEA